MFVIVSVVVDSHDDTTGSHSPGSNPNSTGPPAVTVPDQPTTPPPTMSNTPAIGDENVASNRAPSATSGIQPDDTTPIRTSKSPDTTTTSPGPSNTTPEFIDAVPAPAATSTVPVFTKRSSTVQHKPCTRELSANRHTPAFDTTPPSEIDTTRDAPTSTVSALRIEATVTLDEIVTTSAVWSSPSSMQTSSADVGRRFVAVVSDQLPASDHAPSPPTQLMVQSPTAAMTSPGATITTDDATATAKVTPVARHLRQAARDQSMGISALFPSYRHRCGGGSGDHRNGVMARQQNLWIVSHGSHMLRRLCYST